MTDQEKQNLLERLDWIDQSAKAKLKSGDRKGSAVATLVRESATLAVQLGLVTLAKRQLDRAKVPHVPYLDLDPSRVVVR